MTELFIVGTRFAKLQLIISADLMYYNYVTKNIHRVKLRQKLSKKSSLILFNYKVL